MQRCQHGWNRKTAFMKMDEMRNKLIQLQSDLVSTNNATMKS